ncbi:mycothiol synthase [Antrihabitans cavernicola]|uniref:Mycothiol acetyltransferase n=1 Tax=Antrihabitans cavernicola TaxID=2495913 RepID=A0A5A7S9D1_9NOCA|nr:mycothiol synthase [Spelaeibacter cavernicola]KAA0021849.1 mycothiol synthase [Spelaeibacter cavernicola]
MGWSSALDADSARRIGELVEAATALDGGTPIDEQAVLSLTTESDALHLTHSVDDTIVGYANLIPAHGEHGAMAEVVVDPAARGNGVGTDLVRAALSEGGPGARVWAHGDLPAARAIASKLNLSSARELLQLRRPLAAPELPDVVVPEGISLRTYGGTGDDADILRVNNAAFSWHPEQGGWTQAEIDERRTADWFDPEGLFLAFSENAADGPQRLVGFHWTKVHSETDSPIGEVYVVAIDPAAQGRGLGRLLTVAGLRYLRDRGLAEVLLYVEADNVAAVHTYGRLGFERFHVDVAYATTSHSV